MAVRTPPQKVRGTVPPANAFVVLAVAVLAVLGTLTAVVWTGPGATSTAAQLPGSPAAPTAAEVTPVCQTTTPAASLGPSTSLPANPTATVVTPSGGVVDFATTASALYVDTGTNLVTYSLSGAQQGSFALPAKFTGSSVTALVVDTSGDIYLGSYYGALVDKFSPSGAVLWSVDPQSDNPTGLYSVGTGAAFQVVVSIVQDTKGSLVLDQSTGTVSGSFPLVDNGYVTQEPGGDLLYSANGYVETVSPAGKVLTTFGSAHIEGSGAHTGSGTQFYYPGQSVQGPDGTVYSADPLATMTATSPTGFLKGTTTLGGALAFGGWGLQLVGSTFYYQSGPPFNGGADAISSFSLATLQAYLAAIQAPSNSLGWGAGLSTAATGNYFAAGVTPAVEAALDPWWASVASHVTLSYSVEDAASLDAGTVPTPTTVPLPTTATALASIPLVLPTADTVAGPYQVQATLLDTSTSPPTTLGTTCMPYTVGAPGDALNFATLPAGAGYGGPSDPRGVALNAQLGLSGLRSNSVIAWATLLPKCNASAPTTQTCGPGALTFASASTDPYKAAYLAAKDHVAYWIQASGGEPVPTALVGAGLWQADVASVVAHYATVPSGCGNCAPVTGWEPWNESNNNGWPNGATYTTKVLAPFYAAVKSVLPGSASTVIGGSSLEPAVAWWQQVVAAGGLADMDVASIHPYPGSNDAYEEDGMVAQVRQLQVLLGSKPLWFTEVGWWSDGDYNFLAQSDDVARSLIWQRVLGVPVENYFFDEGGWGNDGVSFSLIEAGASVDYVKPAALATMTTSGLLAGRPFLGMPTTGIPQSYRADFGTTSTGSTDVSALWSDGLPVTASVTVTGTAGSAVPVTVTSEYGDQTTVDVASGTAYSLPLTGQVAYLSYPAGDSLSVGPTEAYGTDVASAAAGATAGASSGNASAAIDGFPAGYGQGWASGAGDSTPSLTVTLAAPTTIDRVVVDTQSVGSTAPGLRNYTISADEPGTGWVTLATGRGQYRYHELQFAVDPVQVSALRVTVGEIDYGGYYGGGIPPFWPSTQAAAAFVHALQAYTGSGGPSVVDGSGLAALLAQPSGGGGGTTTTDGGGSTTTGPPTTTPPAPPQAAIGGYRLVTSAAQVSGFGADPSFGPDGALALNRPIRGMATTPDGRGYWLVASDGGIFNFGDAGFYGSTGFLGLNAPIVGMAPSVDGAGYWLVGADGGIFATGDAPYLGSTGGLRLNKPIVGMASTRDGRGYWLVASDGGIFAYGDAGFYGSTGALHLNKPIVGMAATRDGRGYWLVASDGGIFAFGDAAFHGSTGGLALNAPIVGMASTPGGAGYWLSAADGGIFAFGDATFLGSAATAAGQPVAGISAH
jgi:hypothetical protein